jgi:NitT/TauT family transport system substrate-binding protein
MKSWTLGFALFAALFFAGCSKNDATGSSDNDLPKVKVLINSWAGLGPYYVARAKGFDRDEGVQLQIEISDDTAARNAQLASGEADLVGITLDTVILSRSRGVPMVVVAESDFSSGGDGIIAGPGIEKVADLRGKKVACPQGLPSHFFLLYLLEKGGMGPKDIQLVPVDDGGKAGLLFVSGEVDAAVTWDPWISDVQKMTKGKGHVVITSKETPRLILGIVAANKDRLPQRADKIARTQRAFFKSVAFCKEHAAEADQIMAKEYHVSVDEFKGMIAGAALADLQETLNTFGTRANPGPIAALAKDASRLWQAAGATAKDVPVEDAVDWTIVDALSGNSKPGGARGAP